MNGLGFRLALTITSAVAAAIILSAAVIFLGLAMYHALARTLSTDLAAAVTGVCGLAVGCATLWGGVALARGFKRRAAAAGTAEETLRRHLSELAGTDTAAALDAHPYASVIGALLAGAVVGSSPELRRILRSVIGNLP